MGCAKSPEGKKSAYMEMCTEMGKQIQVRPIRTRLAHLGAVTSVSRHSLFNTDEMLSRTLTPPITVSVENKDLACECVLRGSACRAIVEGG